MSKASKYRLERDLAFLLVDAGRKLNDAYDVHMKPLGLTRSQWRVVAYVSRTPGITQTHLAHSVDLTRMAITGLLDRMQAKSLVERRVIAGDRRVKTVHLTRKSRALVSRMNATAEAVLDNLFSGVPAADKELFRSILQRVKNNAGSNLLDSAES
jgi:DNA-binding MarR family transcriptional regulator